MADRRGHVASRSALGGCGLQIWHGAHSVRSRTCSLTHHAAAVPLGAALCNGKCCGSSQTCCGTGTSAVCCASGKCYNDNGVFQCCTTSEWAAFQGLMLWCGPAHDWFLPVASVRRTCCIISHGGLVVRELVFENDVAVRGCRRSIAHVMKELTPSRENPVCMVPGCCPGQLAYPRPTAQPFFFEENNCCTPVGAALGSTSKCGLLTMLIVSHPASFKCSCVRHWLHPKMLHQRLQRK